MINNKDYKFKVSLSNDAYINKEISGAMIGSTKNEENKRIRKQYGFKANQGVGYKETELTAEELMNELINGKVFCHLFNPTSTRKDGCFSSCQKKDDNFKGSYVVGVDIDHTNYSNVEEFVNMLELKPTFYYTSYSNLQEGKGARFRLIYVFDSIINHKFGFRYVAYVLNKKIENDTHEVIDDDCNLRCSQYFNGTNVNNSDLHVSFGLTNNIYSFEDFGITKKGYIEFLNNNCYYKTKLHKKEISILLNQLNSTTSTTLTTTYYNETEKNTIETESEILTEFSIYDEGLLNDMCRLDYDEFMRYNRHKYTYYYRVEKDDWINDTYQKVDDKYFAFKYQFGKNAVLHDGQHRRKKVFMRMCLRRVMNPSVDANTILFNAYEDIHRFFDWSGLDLYDFLKKNIEYCFDRDVEDIEEEFSNTIAKLREETKPKRGYIYKCKVAHTKESTYSILDEYYNKNLSISENLDMINDYFGFKVGKTTMYEYVNNRNICKDANKISDYDLVQLTDFSISAIDNLKNIKSLGYKIGNKRYNKIYKEYKNIKSSTTAISSSTTTTYYNKTENDTIEENTSTTYYNDIQKVEHLEDNNENNVYNKETSSSQEIVFSFEVPDFNLNIKNYFT